MSSRLPTGSEYERLLLSLRDLRPWALADLDDETITLPAEQVDVESAVAAALPLHEHVRRIAREMPWRVAVSDGEETLSFKEFDRSTEALAQALSEAGAARGVVVAIALERGIALIVAMIAVWKAGAAFVVVDPAVHPEWHTATVREAAARLVVATGVDVVPDVTVISPDSEASSPVTLPTPQPDDLAYLIRTSGSTGRPKLVEVHHGAVSSLLAGFAPLVEGADEHCRVIQFSAPSFDAIIADLVLALGWGIRLEVPTPADSSLSPVELLGRRRITHAVLPAAVVRTFSPDDVPALRVLMSVGERCLPTTAQLWASRVRFVNGYGPTEAGVCTTLHVIDPAARVDDVVPIGTALPGRWVVITDDDLTPLPPGATGEICIGGAGVGSGYRGRADETAARFVQLDGTRLYRSGDLGSKAEDGVVTFLGRKDQQVKIRGVRVEPIEAEQLLTDLPHVLDALVLTDHNNSGDVRLLAYVRVSESERISAQEIRDGLIERVPAHLVPAVVTIIEQWPLTEHGKIDLTALPEPAVASTSQYDGPRDQVEEVLCDIVADLLQVRQIGIHDDFLAMGGHSLLATQFVARIRDALGKAPALSTVLRERTVAGVATALTVTGGQGPVPIVRSGSGRRPSITQQRVWYLQEMAPDSVAYVSQVLLRFGHGLDRAALESSLTALLRRHEVLRTRFTNHDGELRAEILRPWEVRLPVADVTSAEHVESAFGELVRTTLLRPFQLDRDPVVRWQLIRTATDEHVLVHVEHHIVHDGWSVNVFLRDLIAGYRQASCGGGDQPALPLQYYDYSDWQHEWRKGQEAAAHRAFWRKALAGAPQVLALPGTPGERRFRGATPRLEIDAALATRLDALASSVGSTLFITLLSAFFVLLHRYSGARDVLVCSGVANRTWPGIEDVMGMVVNTVVLRSQMTHEGCTLRQLLDQVTEMASAALDHQELPFEDVVDEVLTERVPGVNPLVQAMFSSHDSPHRDLGEVPVEITAVEAVANGTAKFDLNVIAVPRYRTDTGIQRLPGNVVSIPTGAAVVPPRRGAPLAGITLQWEYDTDRFDMSLIEGMLAAYLAILRAVVADVDQPILSLPLTRDQGDRELLALGRGKRGREPRHPWLPALVEHWVQATPSSPAVVTDEITLTYAQLGRHAGGVAARLAISGVRRGDVVALCMPPSARLATAVIGVLRAGAAVVAFDAGDPRERVEWLLTDCQARVVLTTAELAGSIPGGVPVLALDAWEDAPPPVVNGEASDVAYVCYTSGSTGRPKGVPVAHGPVARKLANLDSYFALAPGKRLLQLAPLSFDVGVMEVVGALANGAALHIPGPGWTVPELGQRIRAEEITHVWLVTPLLHQFAAECPDSLTGVDQVLTGGDVVSPNAVRRLLDNGVREVVNGYGPTEATLFSTAHPMWASTDVGDTVSIGRPVPDVQILLLDDTLRLVPRGAVGEVCFAGPGVGTGYLNRPAETASSYPPNPYGDGTLYRSGDMGRWLADGTLEFLGRRDSQVKINGRRVELGEVETTLTALPEVADAIASTVDDRGVRRLACHVLPAPGQALTEAALFARLRASAPAHLVPSFMAVLDAWPLTPSGKVDRAALPELVRPAPALREPPRTAAEQMLADIAVNLLDLREIGVHDDFFALGGDSMLAMKYAARIRTATGVNVGLSTVLAAPTIAGLARHVETAQPEHRPIMARPRNR